LAHPNIDVIFKYKEIKVMKKIIIVLALFASCGYGRVDNTRPIIIKELESVDKNWTCYYGLENKYSLRFKEFCIIDSANKYSVGDTIKLTK
jgi:hypothetical protein